MQATDRLCIKQAILSFYSIYQYYDLKIYESQTMTMPMSRPIFTVVMTTYLKYRDLTITLRAGNFLSKSSNFDFLGIKHICILRLLVLENRTCKPKIKFSKIRQPEISRKLKIFITWLRYLQYKDSPQYARFAIACLICMITICLAMYNLPSRMIGGMEASQSDC